MKSQVPVSSDVWFIQMETNGQYKGKSAWSYQCVKHIFISEEDFSIICMYQPWKNYFQSKKNKTLYIAVTFRNQESILQQLAKIVTFVSMIKVQKIVNRH